MLDEDSIPGKPVMKCPLDGTPLASTERSGVEIDYCPSCRGVWLDRDTFEQVIERSLAQAAPPKAQIGPSQPGYLTAHRAAAIAREMPRRRQRDAFLDDLFDF